DGENETANTTKAKKSSGGSLLPNWFNRGDDQQANRGANQGTSNSSRTAQNGARQQGGQQQTQPRAGSAPRMASRPQRTQAKTNKGQGFSVPGLGGAPLPQESQSAQQSASAGNQSGTTQNDPNYPVIRDPAPRAQSAQANRGVAGGQRP